MTDKVANQQKQKRLIPAAQVFGTALKAIDEFVTAESSGARKRGRDAPLAPEGPKDESGEISNALQQLTTIIAQHRIAAAPSVEQLSKRLTLLLCSGNAADNNSDDAWQCAELCCGLYGAGMSRMMQQVLEHLTNVSATASATPKSAVVLSNSKMERLSSMLRAVGQYISSSLLQQFSQQVALWETTSIEYIGLAETLLCVCSPTPTQLFVRCVELIGISWGTTADLMHLRALHRLKTTLGILRHPTAVPFFIPPADAVEPPLPQYQRMSDAKLPAAQVPPPPPAAPQVPVVPSLAAAHRSPKAPPAIPREPVKQPVTERAEQPVAHKVTSDKPGSNSAPAHGQQKPTTPKQAPQQQKPRTSATLIPDIVID